MRATRSLPWQLLPWLFPVALILVGLVFVTASLTGTDEPENIAAPPNVREVTTRHAPAWALDQVPAGETSEVTGVVMVSSRALDATVYEVRAVVGRVDGAGGTSPRTVVTCVFWDVDVREGTVTEHGADQLSNTPGRHPLGDSSTLRSQCAASTFAG